MWFVRSIELLPRPSFLGLAPAVAMLAVWGVFEGTEPELFGRTVLPLWLALVTHFALTLAARGPALLARGEVSRRARLAFHAALATLTAALGLAMFIRDPWLLQLGWFVGWLGYTGLFVGTLLTFDEDDLALMPYRWASAHPYPREAMWLVALRLAVVALAAAYITARGSLTDWVLFVTFGRMAVFYLFEWVTIVFALTWRDRDS